MGNICGGNPNMMEHKICNIVAITTETRKMRVDISVEPDRTSNVRLKRRLIGAELAKMQSALNGQQRLGKIIKIHKNTLTMIL